MNAPLLRLMTSQRTPEATKKAAIDIYRRINIATTYQLMTVSEDAAIRIFVEAGERGTVALASMLRQLSAIHATNHSRGLTHADLETAGLTALTFLESLAFDPANERAEKTVAELDAQGAFGGVTNER